MSRKQASGPRPARGRRSAQAAPRRSPLRAAWLTIGLLTAVLVASLTATGGSYALWNGTASTSAAPVTSGSSGLLITQQPALDVSALLPGQGVLGTFAAKNTGTVALDVAISVRGTSSNAAFPGELSVRLGSVSSTGACVAGATTWSGRPGTLTTSSAFARVQPGASTIACVQVVLDADAPQTVQGATAALTFAVVGTQVQP
jgi:hypothetical protein